VTSPIVGASSAEQLQESLGAEPLTEDEMQQLDAVTGFDRDLGMKN
jgi:aryl-alcohol dehydrogenase-like predicted oxidoreductase